MPNIKKVILERQEVQGVQVRTNNANKIDIVECRDEMQSLMINEGQYLMFPVKGELPQAIMETWQQIWAYFDDESIDERRAYKTDFEKYISEDEAEIYISVNYF